MRGNVIKVDNNISLEVLINSNKVISFNKDCFIVDTYIAALKENLKKDENFWLNYKVFIEFIYENNSFILKDKFIDKSYTIDLPKSIADEVDKYYQEVKDYILKFIKSLKDESETFFMYNGILTTQLWLPYIDKPIDLFIPSIVHSLNEIAKKKKDKFVFDYEKVCTLLFCLNNYPNIEKQLLTNINNGNKININTLYDLFVQSFK